MDQKIQFYKASDGVRIAYSLVGDGPPLVKAPNWLTHLEYEWDSPVWSHWWKELTKHYTVVRFDQRGSGLSERSVPKQSFDIWVNDLAEIVNHLKLDKFDLLGISQGGPIAASYMASNPGRVKHFIGFGTYARGRMARGDAKEEFEALLTLTRAGWGRNNPAYRQMFTSRFMPGATIGQMGWFNDLQRISTSPENAADVMEVTAQIDVLDLLGRIDVPTLILHARDDAQVPFEQGREFASLVPDARFVPFDGSNHLLLESEPAWQQVLEEVRAFLGDRPAVVPKATSSGQGGGLLAGLTARELEVLELIRRGYSNAEIGAELVITPNTAANHVKSILSKTGTANRTEAAAFAGNHGLTG